MERTIERKESYNRQLQSCVRDVWLNNQFMPAIFPYVSIGKLKDEDINYLIHKLEEILRILFNEQDRRA